MTRAATDRVAERVLRDLRDEMMGRNEVDLRRLETAYQEAAAAIQRDLAALGSVAPRATIERIARERLNTALFEVIPIIQQNVVRGAEVGAQTTGAQFEAIFPDAPVPRIEARAEALREAARVLRGQTTVDSIPLSGRVRMRHTEVAQNMAREVETAMRAGQSSFEVMERVLRADSERIVEVPQYIQRLAEAARDGGPALEREIALARDYIDGLGSVDRGNTSIRSATEELIKRLRRASAEDIDGIVTNWARDKAQYHAKVIARTEANEAHRRAYEAANRGKPWVKGYRWSLGGGHKKPDICDILAGQNLHGLGPGGYTVDSVPRTPHPSDLCTQTAIIDEHYQDRRIAQLEGTPPPPETWNVGGQQTPAEWMAQQPEQLQQQILGPTRLAVFQEHPERVLNERGDISLVRDAVRERPRRRAASAAAE